MRDPSPSFWRFRKFTTKGSWLPILPHIVPLSPLAVRCAKPNYELVPFPGRMGQALTMSEIGLTKRITIAKSFFGGRKRVCGY